MSSGRIPRLFVEQEISEGSPIELANDAAKYLGSVLRLGPEAEVILFDDRTGEWRAVITQIGKRSVTLLPQQRLRARERGTDIWLCCAPIRRQRFEWIAEKACELGAARFVPVVTSRTEPRGIKGSRLRGHMIEAAEQCERTALPELGDTIPLAELLETWPEDRALIFCDEEGGAAALASLPPAPAGILIGPEGGFAPEERARIAAHPAAVRISLGLRVLRADTAAVAALSLWMAVQGDWQSGD